MVELLTVKRAEVAEMKLDQRDLRYELPQQSRPSRSSVLQVQGISEEPQSRTASYKLRSESCSVYNGQPDKVPGADGSTEKLETVLEDKDDKNVRILLKSLELRETPSRGPHELLLPLARPNRTTTVCTITTNVK
eukprot:GHVS01106004.1.p1 GENE.GHVS01106004.1~~GHVS01106004.1.p1  ORF type:complete len:135 (+),score=7.03 GHVS01106004.1:190-594(+)